MTNKATWLKTLLALSLYSALAVVMTYPTVAHMSTHMPGGAGDPLLTCWYLDRNISRYLSFNFADFYESNIFFPHNLTASYSEPFLSTAALGIPFYLLSRGDIVFTHNSTLLLSFVLTAWGTHLLLKRLTGNTLAAILGAIVFAFAPFKIGQIEHLNFVTTQWIPFTFLYLREFAESKTWKHAALFCCFFLLNALATMFYMIAVSLGVGIFALIILLSDKPDRKKFALRLIATLAVAAGALLAAYRPYFAVRDQLSFERGLKENVNYSANPETYLATPSWQGKNLIYGRLLRFDRFAKHEGALFVGFLPMIALIVLAGLVARRKVAMTTDLWFYALLALFCFFLTFGPVFRFAGGVANPVFMLFYRFFPAAGGLRVPTRFGVMVLLSCAVFSGYLVRWATDRASPRFRPLLFALPLISALECFSYPIAIEPLPIIGSAPAVCRWLAAQSDDIAILELPANYPWRNHQYVYYSIFHRKNMVNGYSSYFPPVFNYFNCSPAEELSDERLDAMRYLGVTHLVVHTDILSEEDRAAFRSKLAGRVSSRLKLAKTFDGAEIYEVADAAPRFHAPSSLVGIPDEIRLRVPSSFPPGASCSAAVEFIGSTPAIALSGIVVPSCRQLDYSFLDERGAVVKTGSSRLQDLAGLPLKYSSFSIETPRKEGVYTLRVASSGQIVGETRVKASRGQKTTISPGALKAEIQCDPPTLASEPGRPVTLVARLRNTGDTVWLARSPDKRSKGSQEVRLGYRLFRGDQQIKEGRAPLPFDVAPGERLLAPLALRSPAEPGTYRVKLDLVVERVAWFEDRGSPAKEVELVVSETVKDKK